MTPNLSSGQPTPTPLRLVPLADVRAADPVDYHMHTTYTDGTASILEMAEAAECTTYNCTEGGILFGGNIKSIPLNQFLTL